MKFFDLPTHARSMKSLSRPLIQAFFIVFLLFTFTNFGHVAHASTEDTTSHFVLSSGCNLDAGQGEYITWTGWKQASGLQLAGYIEKVLLNTIFQVNGDTVTMYGALQQNVPAVFYQSQNIIYVGYIQTALTQQGSYVWHRFEGLFIGGHTHFLFQATESGQTADGTWIQTKHLAAWLTCPLTWIDNNPSPVTEVPNVLPDYNTGVLPDYSPAVPSLLTPYNICSTFSNRFAENAPDCTHESNDPMYWSQPVNGDPASNSCGVTCPPIVSLPGKAQIVT